MERRIEQSDPRATQRLLAAMALSLAIYASWVWWRGPPPAPPPEPVPAAVAPPAPAVPPPAPTGPQPPVRELPLAACDLSGQWTTDGGAMRDVTLRTVAAPLVVTPWWTWILGRATGGLAGPWIPYGGEGGPARLLTPEAYGVSAGVGHPEAPPLRYEVLESAPDRVVFRGQTAEGVEIVHRVAAGGEPCVLASEVTWRNAGGAPYTGGLRLALIDRLDVGGGGWFSGPPTGQQHAAYIDDELNNVYAHDLEAPTGYPGPVDWFGLTGHIFGLFVLPEDRVAGSMVFARHGEPPADGRGTYGAHWVREATLAPGESFTAKFRTWGGRLDRALLASVHPALPEVVNFGWMAAFASPMLWALEVIHSLVGNWGVAIILLTIGIKILLYPLINSGMKSSMKMAALQPKLQEIREKYKNEPEEMNRRTLQLFSEGGANPLGGCLPLLAQIPVFASLYGVLLTSADLYQGEFLYLRDLSALDPYGLLPIGTIVLMWAQQQMMPMTNIDPAQQQILKLMPILFGLFFFTAPSGLGVYMLVNIGLSILQQWWIKRQFPQPTPASAPA